MLVDKELNQQYLSESGFVVIYFEIESVCTIQTYDFLIEGKIKALFSSNSFCLVN
jgi:hypothetical protein